MADEITYERFPCVPLTPRETEIAKLAADGLFNREIAERLQISPLTVRNLLQNVFRKLGIHARGKLAARFPLKDEKNV